MNVLKYQILKNVCILQEDELTLIIAGGVLGMIAGGIQLGVNILIIDNNNNRRAKLQRERETEATIEKELLQLQAAPVEDTFVLLYWFHPYHIVTFYQQGANNTEFFTEDSATSIEGNDFAVDTWSSNVLNTIIIW